MKKEKSIPPITRKEWQQLLNGEINHTFNNYVIQMRVYQAQKEIKEGKISNTTALNDLHALCTKYSLTCQDDFVSIFKTW
jgi:hypothetical protein